MFIIFGWRGVTKTVSTGDFNCPQCNCRRPYNHKSARNWFTLFFIPVIPLDKLGEFIECSTCRGTFEMAVLQYDPHRMERLFNDSFGKALLLMAVADGPANDQEVKAVRDLYRQHICVEWPDADVRQGLAHADNNFNTLSAGLNTLGGSLTDQGKELLLHSMATVAVADGPLHDNERRLLESAASAVRMTPLHFQGVLASARPIALPGDEILQLPM